VARDEGRAGRARAASVDPKSATGTPASAASPATGSTSSDPGISSTSCPAMAQSQTIGLPSAVTWVWAA
jgi:hypothetical protein